MSVSEAVSQCIESVSYGTGSQKRFLDEDDQKIVSWLSPTTFWARHQDIMSYRTEDTGKWFLETREFNQWVNGTDKTLWCPGIRKSL